MQTFYGNIKFGSGGQNTAKPMVLFQVMCKSGKCENVVVAPTKWAAAEVNSSNTTLVKKIIKI